MGAGIGQKDIFVSLRFEEIFGREITETILHSFTEQNPDIRIRLMNTADDKSAASVDIHIFDEGNFSSLASSGSLLPLTDSETEEIALAVPLVSFMDLLFYNIELLKTAGFDRPPKTRDEFLSYAKTVSNGENISGAAISLSDADKQAVSRDIFSWIWASGGDFWQGEETPLINNRATVRDLAFLGSLYREGALAPSVFETTGDQRLEDFAQGKIALMIASTRAIPQLREKMGDDAFGITVIPGSGSPLNYSLGLSGIYAGINADCTHPEEARNFLNYLAEQSPLLCAELKATPGIVSDLFSSDYIKDDPFYSKARNIFEASQIVQGFSRTAGAQKFENAVREEFKIFFESGRTAEETAAAIQERWRPN